MLPTLTLDTLPEACHRRSARPQRVRRAGGVCVFLHALLHIRQLRSGVAPMARPTGIEPVTAGLGVCLTLDANQRLALTSLLEHGPAGHCSARARWRVFWRLCAQTVRPIW